MSANSTFYGSDSYCLTDIGLIDTQVTDPNLLICQRLVRRLTTPYGALAIINDVADAGFDVRSLVNSKVTNASIVQAQARIQSECLKDQQVQSCAVTVSADQVTSSLSISIAVVAATGTFSLTLNVTSLTVDLVFNP